MTQEGGLRAGGQNPEAFVAKMHTAWRNCIGLKLC